MLGSRLFDSIELIKSYTGISSGGAATGVIFKTKWGAVTTNFMPQEQLGMHINGFKEYVKGITNNPDTLKYLIARIDHVRMCLGCVIEHEENENKDEDVHEFLFSLNQCLNGLLFMYDSVFDYSGEALCGPCVEDIEEG